MISRANPPVNQSGIQWFYESSDDMVELTPDSDTRYTFSDDKLSLYIRFYPLLQSDEGNYTLVAMNAGGSDSSTLFLDIQGM